MLICQFRADFGLFLLSSVSLYDCSLSFEVSRESFFGLGSPSPGFETWESAKLQTDTIKYDIDFKIDLVIISFVFLSFWIHAHVFFGGSGGALRRQRT